MHLLRVQKYRVLPISFVLIAQRKRLMERVLLSTHNILRIMPITVLGDELYRDK